MQMDAKQLLLQFLLSQFLFAFMFYRVFIKAGKPGWAALVPFYNVFLFFKISGSPGWWVIFSVIPLIKFVFFIIGGYRLAKRFGKGDDYAIACAMFGFIFVPILGYGKSEYLPLKEGA